MPTDVTSWLELVWGTIGMMGLDGVITTVVSVMLALSLIFFIIRLLNRG